MAANAEWTSSADTYWSDPTSWSGAIPATDDQVTFNGGPRSTSNLGDQQFSSLNFITTHMLANGNNGGISLTDGLDLAGGTVAQVEIQLTTTSTQTWTIGRELNLPGMVKVDPTSTLALEISGSMNSSGNLDGQAGSCIIKTGAGILRLSGSGGGVGSCGSSPEGLSVRGGYVEVLAGSNLGGKSFDVVGGDLIGGTLGGPAIVRQLNVNGGTVAPGGTLGAGLGRLNLWGTSVWNVGDYAVDGDPATGASDLVHGDGKAVTVNGTVLAPRVLGGIDPATPTTFAVLDSSYRIDGAFISPAGDTLADGDASVSDGQRYAYRQTATAVSLTWLGVAPAGGGANPGTDPDPTTNPTRRSRIDTAAR